MAQAMNNEFTPSVETESTANHERNSTPRSAREIGKIGLEAGFVASLAVGGIIGANHIANTPDNARQTVQEGTFTTYPGKYSGGDLSGLESAIRSAGGNPETTNGLTFEGQTMKNRDKNGDGTVTYTYSIGEDGKTRITAIDEQAPIADK